MTFDSSTNMLLKAGCFIGVSSSSLELEKFNNLMIGNLFKQTSIYAPTRYFYFIFYSVFAKKFNQMMIDEILKYRSEWLLSHSNPVSIVKLEPRETRKYFQELEKHLYEKYVSNLEKPVPFNFVECEYYKMREVFLISFFKKYSNIVILWSVLLLTFYIGLNITAKENSLTVWDLVKGWYNFLMLRLK